MKKLFIGLLALGSIPASAFNQDLNLLWSPMSQWTINSSSLSFPANFRIIMNNAIITDTCAFPDEARTFPVENGRTQILFNIVWTPEETLSLDIIDLGQECTNFGVYFSEKNIKFTKTPITNESSNDFQVYVELNN